MLEWISDRLWDLADGFTAAAARCKQASIKVLVLRLRREKRQ